MVANPISKKKLVSKMAKHLLNMQSVFNGQHAGHSPGEVVHPTLRWLQ